MEALSEVTEERKQRVPFHGMKIYGSASPFGKLRRRSISSSPMGALKTRLASKEKTVSLLNEESVEFDIKQEPSDFSDNANDGDSGVSFLTSHRLPSNENIGLLESNPSSSREFLLNKIPNDQSTIKVSGYSLKDNQRDDPLPSFSSNSSNYNVNNKKHSFSIKEKVGLSDSVTRTNKSCKKERLKLKSSNIANNDEIVALNSDFPFNGKQFNWSEKRNACDPGYVYFKSKLNLNSRRTFIIKEKQGDNYMESSSSTCHRICRTDVNLGNRLEKIIKCEAKARKSLKDTCLPDDPVLLCDFNDINLSNKLNEDHCLVKFKEIKKNIDEVFIKVEPCDLEVDENDSGIHIPIYSELTTNAALKHVAQRQYIKEESCDRPSGDDENDSGIGLHSPMNPEISGNVMPMDKLCEVVIKTELFESDQIEPWLPWLPLDANKDPTLLRQESHEQLIKNEPLEQDLLKQIKKDPEPLCVSKKKLANKYISKYQKPQLNETGQTFNCSDCDQSFTMKNLLSHHIIYEHNTLKLLKCPICYRRFNKLNGLSNHIRATHKIRRHHICRLCHHSFSRHHYLVYHMRAIHKIVK